MMASDCQEVAQPNEYSHLSCISYSVIVMYKHMSFIPDTIWHGNLFSTFITFIYHFDKREISFKT